MQSSIQLKSLTFCFGGNEYFKQDLNKDGEITANDLKPNMRRWGFDEAYIHRYVTAKIKQYDKNKDGRVIYC